MYAGLSLSVLHRNIRTRRLLVTMKTRERKSGQRLLNGPTLDRTPSTNTDKTMTFTLKMGCILWNMEPAERPR